MPCSSESVVGQLWTGELWGSATTRPSGRANLDLLLNDTLPNTALPSSEVISLLGDAHFNARARTLILDFPARVEEDADE
mmetsp:Transcript_951/g.2588  ORF Transcript_951/g.2588 Transcript_951/m.2588 type:complete len:80 (-) Transcript_951:322-561(-)